MKKIIYYLTAVLFLSCSNGGSKNYSYDDYPVDEEKLELEEKVEKLVIEINNLHEQMENAKSCIEDAKADIESGYYQDAYSELVDAEFELDYEL